MGNTGQRLCHGHMELAVLSLNKNDQGPIFSSEAQTSLVGEWFVIWQKTKQKNTGVMVNIDKCQPRKNRSECLETTLAYNIEFIHKLYKC